MIAYVKPVALAARPSLHFTPPRLVKIAILSDIHSNLEALTSALDAADAARAEAIYCLGDVVGYGADPAACVDLVREWCDGVVMGNHDLAVAHAHGLDELPKDGQAAVIHNRNHLSDAALAYLRDLPLQLEAHGCTFVHATPDAPTAWKRLDTYPLAQQQFDHFATDVCFIGHTHIPAVMANKLGVLNVRPGYRYLINVGSVGQPRDQNPRLSFGLFDTETFEYEGVRLPYDVEHAAEKILDAGLSARLAERLMDGR